MIRLRACREPIVLICQRQSTLHLVRKTMLQRSSQLAHCIPQGQGVYSTVSGGPSEPHTCTRVRKRVLGVLEYRTIQMSDVFAFVCACDFVERKVGTRRRVGVCAGACSTVCLLCCASIELGGGQSVPPARQRAAQRPPVAVADSLRARPNGSRCFHTTPSARFRSS
jgi:hypothetical protein